MFFYFDEKDQKSPAELNTLTTTVIAKFITDFTVKVKFVIFKIQSGNLVFKCAPVWRKTQKPINPAYSPKTFGFFGF